MTFPTQTEWQVPIGTLPETPAVATTQVQALVRDEITGVLYTFDLSDNLWIQVAISSWFTFF